MPAASGANPGAAYLAAGNGGTIGMPELMLPPGILQRAAGAVEILLLAVAAATVLESVRRSATKAIVH